jgi:hypothetical protein
MGKILNNETRAKIRKYVTKKWWAPFIIGFICLLVVAAGLLAMGLVAQAEVVGALSYFTLVAGLIIHFACFLRHENRKGAKNHDSN